MANQPGHNDSAKTADPWPVSYAPGRPIRSVRPVSVHRMAAAANDQEMVEALRSRLAEPYDRYEGLADQVRSWVITIALTLMGVSLLATAVDAYLDGAF